jgi:hypothetical protein
VLTVVGAEGGDDVVETTGLDRGDEALEPGRLVVLKEGACQDVSVSMGPLR